METTEKLDRIKKLEQVYISSLPKEHFPSIISCTIYYLIRVGLYFYLTYNFGFILGIIFTIGFLISYKALIKSIFKLEWTNLQDKLFINQVNKYGVNLAASLMVEDFDRKEIKQEIKEKLFDKVDKLNAKLVCFLADFYWTSPQVKNFSKKAKDKIFEDRVFDITLNSESDYDSFLEQHINIPLDPFVTPVEIYIIEFKVNSDKNTKSKRGAILIKADHTLSDGLGFISLLGFIDKIFTVEKYPAIMRRSFDKGLLYYIKTALDVILGITVGAIQLFSFLLSFSKEDNRYKRFVKTKGCKNSGICLTSKTSTVDLIKIKEFCRKNKISINDLMVYSVLQAFKDLSPESKYITLLIPIGFSNLPKKAEELELYNKAGGFLDLVKLPEDSKNFKIVDLAANMYKIRTAQILYYLLGEFCHFSVMKYFQYLNYPEMTISNVPAQEKEIYIGKCRVHNMIPLANTGSLCAFTALCSYNGKLNIKTAIEKDVDIDPDILMNKIKSILDFYAEGKEN